MCDSAAAAFCSITCYRVRQVFYFFHKGAEYVRCEIQAATSGAWEITVTEPNGDVRVEEFTTSKQAEQRWETLQERFAGDGWFGPFGRE
jgi:hypothetical protein